MASYISVRFEKDELPATSQVRIVLRNLDHGSVPPQPSITYFPTDPDSLRTFIVVEFVSRVTGENFVRVATVADFTAYTELALTRFEDTGADFITAGVAPGDIIEVTLAAAEVWTSEEYPGTNPFTFVVDSVISATQLQTTQALPAFGNALTWNIPTRSITGSAGTTIRNTDPADSTRFLERRFNRYFTDAVAAENFVVATKADVRALASTSTGAGLVNESYTGVPS